MSSSDSPAQSFPVYVALNRQTVKNKQKISYQHTADHQTSTSTNRDHHQRTMGKAPSELKAMVVDPEEQPG